MLAVLSLRPSYISNPRTRINLLRNHGPNVLSASMQPSSDFRHSIDFNIPYFFTQRDGKTAARFVL